MRKKVAVPLVATLVTLSFVGVAFARDPTIMGEVISVNPTRNTLTIKAEWGSITFRVEERASRALTNLKPGDKVTVMTYSFTGVGPLEGELDWMPRAHAITKD